MDGGSVNKLNVDSDADHAFDATIEELCKNLCELQSSTNQSPSRQSSGSYGDDEESKIDSDLQHLALGESPDLYITEDDEEEEDEGKVAKPEEEFDTVRPASASKSISPEVMPKDKEKQVGKKNANRLGLGNATRKKKVQICGNEEPSSENVELARYLLNQARNLVSSGESISKALELSLRASKLFEASANNKKPCLEQIMCLHVTASIHCKLKEYNEAIPILQRSIELTAVEEGEEGQALAKFSGLMQLGDTYAMTGQLENSVSCYTEGLTIQKKFLGENDPRVGETCRYLAEALVQALRFDEAEKTCQTALSIHRQNGSIAEAADRRLMGLICETKGDHESALEHLVLASMAMSANGGQEESEVAFVDTSIGDSYLSLSRFDEAISAYQKSLTALKTVKGENHPSVGSVYIRLADLYNRTGKTREAKSYCDNALRIYESDNNIEKISPEEIASGLTDISVICESMNEVEQAVALLQKALKIYGGGGPGQRMMVAGIEAQMGVLYYMMGKYLESYNTFKSAVEKLRGKGKKQSTFYGIALNQMGLACLQLDEIEEGVELFEEAKRVLEQECGMYHPETLGVYNNLAGAYDAIGRLEDAIVLLGHVVGAREEKLGTANFDTEEEKTRLVQLLKEAGKGTGRKAKSLQSLIDSDLMTSSALR